MKKLMTRVAGVVGLVGASYFVGAAWAQSAKDAAVPADLPHRLGLIDNAFVFQSYEKFTVLREDLKLELQDSEQKAKAMEKQHRELKEELKTFKEGSADYIEREKQMAKVEAEFQAFRAYTQKEMLRKEAKIYHTIQLEIQDAIEKFCKHYHYTMVLRFSREEINSTDPQKVMQSLSRPVMYYRDTDDLTEPVLNYLNERYQAQVKAAGVKKTVPPVSPPAPPKAAAKPGNTKN